MGVSWGSVGGQLGISWGSVGGQLGASWGPVGGQLGVIINLPIKPLSNKEGRRVPRSANNPPRPSGGTASLTTCLLRLKRSFSWRLQTQFSKSCLPLSYNGYFCCQYAVLPGRQRFPATPADSPPTPRRLPGDPRRLPGTPHVVRRLGPWETCKPLKTGVFTAL